MGKPAVVLGGQCQCSFGTAPSALTVLPTNRVLAQGRPAATIMDHIPLVNVLPFGQCMTLSNPTVAAATAAALGVLTPMPCIPVTSAPWTPMSPTTLIGGNPALVDGAQTVCTWGGIIEITNPGSTTVLE